MTARSAIRLGPTEALPYRHRGLAYWNKGDYEQAIADLTEAIRIDPNMANAYYDRGMVNLSRGTKAGADKQRPATSQGLSPTSPRPSGSTRRTLRRIVTARGPMCLRAIAEGRLRGLRNPSYAKVSGIGRSIYCKSRFGRGPSRATRLQVTVACTALCRRGGGMKRDALS